MKINYTSWGKSYKTPHLSVVVNNSDAYSQHYIQVSFVVWNFHWWIIIPVKNKNL